MAARLSPTQLSMLTRLHQRSERTPFVGGRSAGLVAAAWYRTAQSLVRLGYAVLEREGDAYRAHLSARGVQFLAGYLGG
jgi:hypothetical protein